MFKETSTRFISFLLRADAYHNVLHRNRFIVFRNGKVRRSFLQLMVGHSSTIYSLGRRVLRVIDSAYVQAVFYSYFRSGNTRGFQLAVVFIRPGDRSIFRSVFFCFRDIRILYLQLVEAAYRCRRRCFWFRNRTARLWCCEREW